MPFMQMNLGGGGFGPTLQQLRELRRLSREQLSDLTKIHTSIIAALEEERLADLSDPVYAERHVRALVSVLEGRTAYFVPKYRELVDAYCKGQSVTTAKRRLPRRSDFFVTTRVVAFAGFLILVLLAAGYLIWQARMVQEPPLLRIVSPVEGEHLAIPRVDVKGETAPGAIVTVNGRTAVVVPDGHFSLSFDVPRGLTMLTIVARRRYGSSVTETRSVTYEREPGPVLEPQEPKGATTSTTNATTTR
jgi:hypothetical protein